MFENVLVPTDGSEPAEEAVQTGIELAADQDATIHGLYILEPDYTDDGSEMAETLERKGERIVSDVAREAEKRDISAVTEVRSGTPHEEILEYAGSNADVLVMGTHGRTGLGRYLLGSVTQKIVRLADVPVLTVQVGED